MLPRCRPAAAIHFRECLQRDEKSAICPTAARTTSPSSQGKEEKNSLKLSDQCGNVFENKGRLWKTWGRTGNVIENKGTYTSQARMLLKIEDLHFEGSGTRSQDMEGGQ
jgi:hypothetical protein